MDLDFSFFPQFQPYILRISSCFVREMSAVTSATGKMIIVSKWYTNPFNTSSCENKRIRLSVLNPYLITATAAAAAKWLQLCPTLCDPLDGSPPGSTAPGILQARTLEWVAISFSSAWKWKVKVKSLSHVWLFAAPWTAAYQAPPFMGFSRQEYWSGLPLPSPISSRWLPNTDLPWCLVAFGCFYLCHSGHFPAGFSEQSVLSSAAFGSDFIASGPRSVCFDLSYLWDSWLLTVIWLSYFSPMIPLLTFHIWRPICVCFPLIFIFGTTR